MRSEAKLQVNKTVSMPAVRPWKVEPSNMNGEASPYLKSFCYELVSWLGCCWT